MPARRPTTIPATMMYGTSTSEPISVWGMGNSITSPTNQRLSRVAVTVAMMMGTKLVIAYSIMTTSMAKITPAMGVLNDAPIAAADPQATSVRTQLSGSRRASPSRLEVAAPRCTAGPSLPPDSPVASPMTPPTN